MIIKPIMNLIILSLIGVALYIVNGLFEGNFNKEIKRNYGSNIVVSSVTVHPLGFIVDIETDCDADNSNDRDECLGTSGTVEVKEHHLGAFGIYRLL